MGDPVLLLADANEDPPRHGGAGRARPAAAPARRQPPEVSALVARATADDMPSLSHDIVGRLMPHYVLWSGTYGEHATRATRRRRRLFVRSLTLFGLQASCSCTCTGASRGCA